MKICPNLSSPEVAKEFNELVEAVGEKAAYQIWSLNNGNNIDKAPNGEPSILFQELLTLLHNDRKKAIQAKARLYTKNFISWFGDWTGEYEDQNGNKPYTEVSKVVDYNGEPKIVYHGSNNNFNTFSTHPEGRETAIYATSNPRVAETYISGRRGYIYNLYANIKHPLFVSADGRNWSDVRSNIATNVDIKQRHINEQYFADWNTMLTTFIIENKDVAQYVNEELERNQSYQMWNNGLSNTEPEIDYFELMPLSAQSVFLHLFAEQHQNLPKDWITTHNESRLKPKPGRNLSTRDIEQQVLRDNILNTDYDGIIVYDVNDLGGNSWWDHIPSDIYISKSPNQLKHINNNGAFSQVDDNIYNNKSPRLLLRWADNFLDQHKRTYKAAVYVKDLVWRNFRINVGFYKDPKTDTYHLNTTPYFNGTDTIARDESVWPKDQVETFAKKLNETFDNKFHIQILDEDQWLKQHRFSNQSNSMIDGNNIWLRGSRVNGQIAGEEILHTLVYNMKWNNPELFNALLERAQHDFVKLKNEIYAIYNENEHRDEELVTQVLSRYVFKKYKEDQKTTDKNKGLLSTIKKFIADFGKAIYLYFKSIPKFNEIFDRYDITVENFTDRWDFEDLADLILSEDARFIELTTLPSVRNNISPNSKTPFSEQLYSAISDAKQQQKTYLDQVKKQYKKDTSKDMSQSQINQALSQFNKDNLQQHLDRYQQTIAEAYKMYMNNGIWVSTRPSASSDVLEYVVNALNPTTFDKYRTIKSAKYRVFAPVQDQYSIVNVIRQAFEDGNIETLDKEMVRDYVRMLWNTDLIQTGLDMFNTDGKQTSEQLEQKLVDAVTSENLESRIHNQKILDYIKTFWSKLNDLVKQLFGKHNYTKAQQDEILTAIQSAQIWNEELETSEKLQPIYDRTERSYEASIPQTTADDKAFSTIIEGTKTRLKAANAKKEKNQALINKLKTQIEDNDLLNTKNLKDEYNLVIKTLQNAEKDLQSTLVYLTGLDYDNVGSWNTEQLNAVQRDLIGFYTGIIDSIQALFPEHGESGLSLYNKYIIAKNPNGIDVQYMANNAASLVNRVQEFYQNNVLLRFAKYYIDQYIDTQDQLQDKDAFKARAERFLKQDAQYGNLAAGEVVIGMASRSKSPVIRVIDSIIADTDAETGRIVLRVGQRLVSAYNKVRPVGSQISPVNYQKRFMALDRNGVPTGYLINNLNRGQFYIDRDEFITKLNDKYSNKEKYGDKAIEVDETGHITWPDEDETADNSIYNQYNDELDEWLDKHCLRRYTLDYYKKRRRYLSRYALQKQRQIQRDIAILTQKATVETEENGKKFSYIDTTKLTSSELKRLKTLRKQKRDLGSHYIITSDPQTGLLSVEEKQGDALKIADEISSWNQFLRGHVKYKPNWDVFNKVKEQTLGKDVEKQLRTLRSQSFLDPNKTYTEEQINAAKDAENQYNKLYKKYTQFMNDNAGYQITSQFWDLLKDSLGSYDDTELKMLTKRHSELVSALKGRDDLCAPNLSTRAGLGINTDRSMWRELKRLEQAIADRKRYLIEHDQKNDGSGEVQFASIAHMQNAVISDQNPEAFLPYLFQQWRNAATNNTDLNGVFNDLFTYTDEKGKLRYLNVFSYLEPNGFEVTYTNSKGEEQTITAIEQVPINEYSSLDEQSDFVNNESYAKSRSDYAGQQYDANDFHSMQPIYAQYKDERYASLTDKEKEFVDVLRSTLDEANSKIPQRALSRDGLLPQITGNKMSLLGRNAQNGEFWRTLGYCVQDLAGKTYAESDKDATTNWDLPRRPDGSYVNNIPIRYTTRLKNRALLSTDVVGSIIEYYNMATNFEQKSKSINQVELVEQALRNQATKEHRTFSQADKAKNLLSQHYYGKTTSFSYNDDENITSKKARTIQGLKTFRKLATWAMLGANFTTIQVGYLDALMSAAADAFGGKYMDGSDFRYGFTHSLMHFVKMIGNIGNPAINDKLSAAMQYNQLSRSNSEIFGKLDQSKASRILSQYFTMGGYTLTDYIMNSAILMSFYHSCRLITLPDGKQTFLNKSEAINELTKRGYTEKEAIETWKKSKTNLLDAYELKNGLFTVKDKYKNIVTKRIENLMQKKLHDRTAVYNGIVPESEKAKLQQNIFTSYISLMRGFFINTYWERFNTGVDYTNLNDKEDVNWRSEYKRDDMGFEDLRTGEFQGALFKDFCRGMSKGVHNMVKGLHLAQEHQQLTRSQMYAVKRCGAELTIIAALIFSLLAVILPWAFNGDDDDDKDPVWTLNIFDPEGEDRSFIEVDWDRSNNSLKNWIRWKCLLLNTRLINERFTPWLPQTAMDLITSPTTALSYYDNLSKTFDLGKDLITGDINNEIRSGGYKGMSKGTKDFLQMFSHVPINNIIKDFHVGGLKSTFNYYRNQSVLPVFIPSMKEWKDDQGDSENSLNDDNPFDTGFSSDDLKVEF